MASFRLYLDTRTPRKDGTYPLKIAINHRNVILINLKVYTTPEYLIDGRVIIPGDKYTEKNRNDYIKARLIKVENTLNRLRVLGELQNISDKELRRLIDMERLPIADSKPLFSVHWQQFVSRKSKGSRRMYGFAEAKLRAYCNFNNLAFEDITLTWLRSFDEWMSYTCSTNSRSIYMRCMRAVINNAIDEEIIDQNLYAFRKFKIKNERTRKRSLTVEDLRLLRDYQCCEKHEKYRDIFMLIFYLIGINTIDLFNAKSLTDGRIEYKRAKTGRLYSIKVEPEAQALIDKYKGKKHLLWVLDNYENYTDFTRRLNRNLKEIGPFELITRKDGKPGPLKKKYNGLFPDLTTYWARHTWATIAASLDIPKETIAAALGHGGNTVTDIYIDFDQKKVDEANRKVIDFIFNL